MNFDKPPQPPGRSLVSPKDPAPREDEGVGSNWMAWDIVIEPGGSANLPATGPGGSTLAATLSWRVAPRRKLTFTPNQT